MSLVSVISGLLILHHYASGSPSESLCPKRKRTQKGGEKRVGRSHTPPRSYASPLEKETKKLASRPTKSLSSKRFAVYSKGGEAEESCPKFEVAKLPVEKPEVAWYRSPIASLLFIRIAFADSAHCSIPLLISLDPLRFTTPLETYQNAWQKRDPEKTSPHPERLIRPSEMEVYKISELRQ